MLKSIAVCAMAYNLTVIIADKHFSFIKDEELLPKVKEMVEKRFPAAEKCGE